MKNFHTHTYRCNHASGRDEDYVKCAIEAGIKVLGFSDHSPWKYNSDFKSHIRMSVQEFDQYYQSIYTLKEKYKDQIEIKIGLECEYFPEYHEWLKEFVQEKKLDYVIFGNHYHESDETGLYYGTCTRDNDLLEAYTNSCIEGLKTGIYSYLAHPDLFMRTCRTWDEACAQAAHKICSYCKEHDVIIEYNLAGLRASRQRGIIEYPHPEFWKIASQYKNKVIIGVDAHQPKDLLDVETIEQSKKLLLDLGLEIVDDIKFLK